VRIEGHNVGYRHVVIATASKLNGIAGGRLTLSLHREIISGATTLQEALHHVISTESDAELVARHAGLCHEKLRGTYLEAVSDPDVLFKKPLGREVLSERSPREFHPGKLSTPILIMLEGINVDGLLQTAVHGKVGLPVALEVQPVHSNTARHRRLPYRREHGAPAPLDLLGKTYID